MRDSKLLRLGKRWELLESSLEGLRVIYNAYVLREESRNILLSKWVPLYSKVYGHHMTVDFGKQYIPKNVGEERDLVVIGYSRDSNCECVVIDKDRSVGLSHITISCREGISPVYSNELLKGGWGLSDRIVLRGRLGSFTTKGWIYG
jgi:hypothetical protein